MVDEGRDTLRGGSNDDNGSKVTDGGLAVEVFWPTPGAGGDIIRPLSDDTVEEASLSAGDTILSCPILSCTILSLPPSAANRLLSFGTAPSFPTGVRVLVVH